MKDNRKDIAIYIPNYNGADFLEQVCIPKECACVVMDNVSVDRSQEICQKRKFLFIGAEKMISRVDNWIRCLNHFKKSEYKWMKWLFVGDKLTDEAYQYMVDGVKQYPDAAAIVFNHYIEYKGKCIPVEWNRFLEEGYVPRQKALKSYIHKGYYGTPICVMFSQSIDFKHLENSGYEWAADIYLFFLLTREHDIAYKNKFIGKFNYESRKMYSKKRHETFTYIEEMDVLRRIQKYYEMKYHEKIDISDRVNHFAQQCIENNCHGLKGILKYQYSVIRCLVKNILRRGV